MLGSHGPDCAPHSPLDAAAPRSARVVLQEQKKSSCPEADVAAAKQKAQRLTWADGKLASDGSPEAATMQTKAAAAVAEFKALKKGGSAPAAAAPVSAPVAAAPARVAPVLLRRRRQRARRTLRWPGRRHSCSPGRPTS